jgi:hypothetical protein
MDLVTGTGQQKDSTRVLLFPGFVSNGRNGVVVSPVMDKVGHYGWTFREGNKRQRAVKQHHAITINYCHVGSDPSNSARLRFRKSHTNVTFSNNIFPTIFFPTILLEK